MWNIFFCDTNEEFISATRAITERFGTIIFRNAVDINTLTGDDIAFVSPSNSLLLFDYQYTKMFPSLEKTAKTLIQKYPYKLGENHSLPIGSAMIIPVNTENNNFVIAAPTMETPSNIIGTHNVYFAILASLMVISKYNCKCFESQRIRNVVIPSMGTGMTISESIAQIREAMDAFFRNKDIFDELPNDSEIYLSNRGSKDMIRIP